VHRLSPRARALLSERLDEQARRLKEATDLHRRMQAERDWKRLPDGVRMAIPSAV
jgi:hypothetical protein